MKAMEYMNNSDDEHLPEFMRDFHDQKDLFKAIYDQWNDGDVKNQVLQNVNSVDAHVFTIDYFLWWMGLHGYKLQKSRKKGVEFYDPVDTIEYRRKIRQEKQLDILNSVLKTK